MPGQQTSFASQLSQRILNEFYREYLTWPTLRIDRVARHDGRHVLLVGHEDKEASSQGGPGYNGRHLFLMSISNEHLQISVGENPRVQLFYAIDEGEIGRAVGDGRGIISSFYLPRQSEPAELAGATHTGSS